MPVPAWQQLADALLHREAARCRIVAGVPPRDFAGLYVDDDGIERALRQLPGLRAPAPDDVARVDTACAPAISQAWQRFRGWRADHRADRLANAGGLSAAEGLLAGPALDETQAAVLAVVAAIELDPQRQRLIAYVQDDVRLNRLTLPTLARLLPGALADAGPASRLVRSALILVGGEASWAGRMLSLPARLAWSLAGDDWPDPDLPAGTRLLPATSRPGPRPGADRPSILLVNGRDPQSRLRAARSWLGGLPLLVTSVPDQQNRWQAVVREASLSAAAVLLRLDDVPDAALNDALGAADHLIWVLDSRGELPLESLPSGRWEEIAVPDLPAGNEQWQQALGIPAPAERSLNEEQLRLVAAAAGGEPGAVAPAVRRLAGGHLEGVAVRVRPRRGWPDLILPADQIRQLQELATRHRLRRKVYGEWGFPAVPSTGVVALFAGPSGTGKTLAAEVVAAELGLDLYKVDLSAVVSKYIGETEKNLERIFTAAGSGDMVLFFDEADAIFGKRSEVSDAHDRYANIEVAYLLQRLESYDGLVVMATNLQRNIDQAFLRRISIALDFTAPDEQHRRAIWEHSFPPGAPVHDLDLGLLARQFKVTGGVIRNVALAAAFLAADEDTPISMPHVVAGLRREFQKLGRLLTESEFGPWLPRPALPGTTPAARTTPAGGTTTGAEQKQRVPQ